MAETQADITEEIRGITLSDREILLHLLQHIEDQHDLLISVDQELTAVRAQVHDMHEELETARPLIERWQHSKINQLIAGRLPWQT